MSQARLSVIIPTLNESANIKPLLGRLAYALDDAHIVWEAIFIDDHSQDDSVALIQEGIGKYPVQVFLKQGKRGKAYSLLEGFKKVQYENIAILDADMQYPPEALPHMVQMLQRGSADIVVANRQARETSLFRRFLSRTFNFVFAKFLHGFEVDVQAGLKVFRRKILDEVVLEPTPWTFDLEFLLSARNYGYVIGSVPIIFAERQGGESKIKFIRAMYEIGWNALKLRLKGRVPFHILPKEGKSMIGAGVAHNRQRFVTHTTLQHHFSALNTFAPWQRNTIFLTLFLVVSGLVWNALLTGIIIIACLSTVYFIDTVFNLGLVLKSLQTPPEIESSEEELMQLSDDELPIYSILCPLYKEAHMLPGFVAAIEKIKWPKMKLDVLLLLEENDPETVAAARAMKLPSSIRIIVVPHSMPKTKPKACNYGLSLAFGEYIVIYDAEDIPDPWQLRKAYLGFVKAGSAVKCLQAKLNYFNPHQNLLTRFFTAEYSLWFDIILVGLQSINTSIPLGGTSNHFRTKDLFELEGWDPFNVTEDCDLGVRIFKRGFRTAIIDSVTLEEANSRPFSWLKQRSRWIKGYMQTYLVHMRHPVRFARENGIHALYFQLVVGGKLAFLFINPVLWVTTIAYFTLYAYVGPTIQMLYPQWVFYMAAISLVFGNFFYIYYYMIGCAKRQHWPLIKYIFLVPLYWVMGSTAAYIALYELIVKPYYWQKTTHGLQHSQTKWVDSILPKTLVSATAGHVVWFRRRVAWIMHQPLTWWRTSTASVTASTRRILEKFGSFWQSVLIQTRKYLPRAQHEFIFSSKGALMLGLIFSNFLNFVFNAFLGRTLSFEALALVTLMNTLGYFVMIIIGAFSSTVNHRTAYLVAAEDAGMAYQFFRHTLRNGVVIALGVSLCWMLVIPFLNDFFRVESSIALYFFTPVFSFSILLAGYRGFLQGNLFFASITVLLLSESFLKLLLAALFVVTGYAHIAYLSIPLSVVCTAIGAFVFTWSWKPVAQKVPSKTILRFPVSFFSASLLTNLSAITFLSVDIFLVNHYFEPVVAGQYALLSLVGKMIYFLGSLPNAFTLTFVSRNEGLKQKSTKVLRLIYIITSFIVLGGVILLGFFGASTTVFLFGAKATIIVPWLVPYTIALSFFTLASVTVSYHLAKKHYLFSVVNFFLALSMIGGIILSHSSIGAVVRVVLFTSVSGWIVLGLLHVSYGQLRFVRRAFRDLIGIFYNGLPKDFLALPLGKKRILIFNWRDTKHKFAGGAEVYVHEIAREWVKEGNRVTLFCGNDGREKRHEVIDGVRVVRRGGFYLVYVWAFFYYIFRFRGKYDVVIDCENGIPFFTPIYVRKPIVCLLHHVHQEVFYYSLPLPLAWLASFLEKDMMTFFYRKVRFITVSESSKEEMQSLGIGKAGVAVVHPGVHLEEYSSLLIKKTTRPTILYLGRLKAYKSVNILIQAFRLVLSERPDAELIIAGDGEERSSLTRLAHELRLHDNQIRFLGRVSNAEKIQLLRSSWVFVNPSFREGWGIVNIEANAAGTPVIAANVPGLRDSVRDMETGFLVAYGDVKAFAEKILEIVHSHEVRETMVRGGLVWAEKFTWHRTSKNFFDALFSRQD